jgi:hypothetical protein
MRGSGSTRRRRTRRSGAGVSRASRGESAARRDGLGRRGRAATPPSPRCRSGHERRGLRGLTDRDLCEYAQGAKRSLVTYNSDDFLELDRRFRGENRRHCGIVILNPCRFPQGQVSIGPLVTSLGQLIAFGPPYESFIRLAAVTGGGVLPGARGGHPVVARASAGSGREVHAAEKRGYPCVEPIDKPNCGSGSRPTPLWPEDAHLVVGGVPAQRTLIVRRPPRWPGDF